MRLSPRLLKIAGLVPEETVVADIGTDHGLLAVYLIVSGRCPRVIATDQAAEPLAAARRTVLQFDVADRVELRQGPGLTVLDPREAEVLVLAGMGGDTMTAVLRASPEVADGCRRIILQPMRSAAGLRAWLARERFRPLDEELVQEGRRIFEVIAAAPPRPRSPADWEAEGLPPLLRYVVGPCLWEKRHPLLAAFLAARLAAARRGRARPGMVEALEEALERCR